MGSILSYINDIIDSDAEDEMDDFEKELWFFRMRSNRFGCNSYHFKRNRQMKIKERSRSI
jgi:hypothetical protein